MKCMHAHTHTYSEPRLEWATIQRDFGAMARSSRAGACDGTTARVFLSTKLEASSAGAGGRSKGSLELVLASRARACRAVECG